MVQDLFDSQFQTKSTDAARAVGTSSNMRKASSTANVIDDLTSVFGGLDTRYLYFYYITSAILG